MKKYVLFLLLTGMFTTKDYGQSANSLHYVHKGRNQQLSFSASIPVGRYADSHVAGAGMAYNWSDHRFGGSVNARHLIGFTAQAGFDYFFGKKQTVAGYPFRYGNQLYLQAMPGIIYNPTANANIILLAGPSLGIYKEASSLSLAVNLSGSYYLNPKIAVGPSVVYRKHAEVDALWTAGVKLGYTF